MFRSGTLFFFRLPDGLHQPSTLNWGFISIYVYFVNIMIDDVTV